jgi:hypothetical protein
MVAAFYLRYVVSMYELDAYMPTAFQFCLQFIDISLCKFAIEHGLLDIQTASDDVIQHAIVQLCQQYSWSPFQFNQGVWYASSAGSSL